MDDKQLKKCPFCGGEAELYEYEAERNIYDSDTLGYVDTEYFTKYGVACTLCNCLMAEYKSEEIAIEAWNERKPIERIAERLEGRVDYHAGLYAKSFSSEDRGAYDAYNDAIEIVKEEGGLND